MSEERIKELMRELLAELEATDDVDAETMGAARQLQTDVNDFVNPEVDTPESSVLDDAIALEAGFAASYPVAERILRELVNNLSRIGI